MFCSLLVIAMIYSSTNNNASLGPNNNLVGIPPSNAENNSKKITGEDLSILLNILNTMIINQENNDKKGYMTFFQPKYANERFEDGIIIIDINRYTKFLEKKAMEVFGMLYASTLQNNIVPSTISISRKEAVNIFTSQMCKPNFYTTAVDAAERSNIQTRNNHIVRSQLANLNQHDPAIKTLFIRTFNNLSVNPIFSRNLNRVPPLIAPGSNSVGSFPRMNNPNLQPNSGTYETYHNLRPNFSFLNLPYRQENFQCPRISFGAMAGSLNPQYSNFENTDFKRARYSQNNIMDSEISSTTEEIKNHQVNINPANDDDNFNLNVENLLQRRIGNQNVQNDIAEQSNNAENASSENEEEDNDITN